MQFALAALSKRKILTFINRQQRTATLCENLKLEALLIMGLFRMA
jgi:hypothetical protein